MLEKQWETRLGNLGDTFGRADSEMETFWKIPKEYWRPLNNS
jgi:hypothetical protein